MYKKLSVGLATLLVLLAYPAFAYAQEDELMYTTAEPTETSIEDERAERVKEYKAAAKDRLTAAQEKRVAGVCKTAQMRLEKVQSAVEETAVKRQDKLNSVVQKLKDLSAKLQKASVDTTELDALITVLEQKVTDFLSEFSAYQQIIEDTTAIDCESDPEAFKASLEAARAKRAELKESSKEIRQYVTETIKPLLVQIKTTLEQSEGEE